MSEWNRIPRSVRQIGNPESSCRIYLEDYAGSYIRKLETPGPEGLRAGILYGKKLQQDGIPGYYVFGAAQMQGVWSEGRLRFGQRVWKQGESIRQEYFPAMEIIGWFLKGEESFLPSMSLIQKTQDTFFAEVGELVLVCNGWEDIFYRKGESLLYCVQGHFLFYQQNTAMQDYIWRMTDARQDEGRKEGKEIFSGESVGKLPKEELQEQTGIEASEDKTEEEKNKITERRQEESLFTGSRFQEGRQRLLAVVLFLLLAAGVIFYGREDRVKEAERVIAEKLFGQTQDVPVGAAAEQTSEPTEETEKTSETDEAS